MKDKTGRRYTRAETELIAELARIGWTYQEISDLVGRRPEGVRKKMWHVGAPKNGRGRWTEHALSILQLRIIQGAPYGDIARELGTTTRAIISAVRRYGLSGQDPYVAAAHAVESRVRNREMRERSMRGEVIDMAEILQ